MRLEPRVILIDPSAAQLRAAAKGDVPGFLTSGETFRRVNDKALARWVDRQGRTHVRVVPSAEGLEAVAALADSSPLAAVYPDVAHRVSAGDGWRWRVVCACGEAGAPEALAWMGPHC